MRTDEDVIAKTPIEVTLGSEKYYIPIRTIGPAREWRALLVSTMGGVGQALSLKALPENLGAGLTAAMIQFPDKLLDLIVAYAPDLPKDKIEAEATDEQLAVAYGRIVGIAFPFLASLAMTRKVLTSQ